MLCFEVSVVSRRGHVAASLHERSHFGDSLNTDLHYFGACEGDTHVLETHTKQERGAQLCRRCGTEWVQVKMMGPV